ncbi:MAG: response regulator [Lachnospiraceae bacterium]|nr:response regulator [Lachnospiraceae bacterium]
MNEVKNILIIADQAGYITASIKSKFEEKSCKAIVTSGKIKEIDAVKDELEAVIIYSDEKLVSDQQALVFIRDKILEKDAPLFVVGDSDELSSIGKIISDRSIIKKYNRPINVTDMVSEITEYLEDNGKSVKKKILVVDDSGAMLRNVKGWLEGKYQVILANSGTMAIKYLAINRPDLVLLDYEMPVIDGKQVLEMIRSESEFADVPVVFLTSKNDKESVAKVVSLRPEGYLLKTMKPAEIIAYVDEFFEKKRIKEMMK